MLLTEQKKQDETETEAWKKQTLGHPSSFQICNIIRVRPSGLVEISHRLSSNSFQGQSTFRGQIRMKVVQTSASHGDGKQKYENCDESSHQHDGHLKMRRKIKCYIVSLCSPPVHFKLLISTPTVRRQKNRYAQNQEIIVNQKMESDHRILAL